eukprot:Awhi_evm1s1344
MPWDSFISGPKKGYLHCDMVEILELGGGTIWNVTEMCKRKTIETSSTGFNLNLTSSTCYIKQCDSSPVFRSSSEPFIVYSLGNYDVLFIGSQQSSDFKANIGDDGLLSGMMENDEGRHTQVGESIATNWQFTSSGVDAIDKNPIRQIQFPTALAAKPMVTDRNYIRTFLKTGCQNKETNQIQNWKSMFLSAMFLDMYRFCNATKTGTATEEEKIECCGVDDIDCNPKMCLFQNNVAPTYTDIVTQAALGGIDVSIDGFSYMQGTEMECQNKCQEDPVCKGFNFEINDLDNEITAT